MIFFSKPSITALEKEYILDAIENNRISGDGKYTKLVYEQFSKRFHIKNMLLTTSGTAALEMSSILINLKPGDEVILPSFTFASTANAFILRGAKPIFCDIRSDTMNMDERLIEELITDDTKAICTIDYAGVPSEMTMINYIAKKHNLFVIEDAAQAVGSYYDGRPAGTLADFGCFSFHDTKNYSMGEGGALICNREEYQERAENIREKGTNRSKLLKGLIDKYTWIDIGSSFLPSDILAAILCAQMERFDEIMEKRMNIWNTYQELLIPLEDQEFLRRPIIPGNIRHNAHMYNIILPNDKIRTKLINYLREKEIYAYICYVPLHTSLMGKKLGYKASMCPVTEDYGERVLRLPLYPEMTKNDAQYVVSMITQFFDN